MNFPFINEKINKKQSNIKNSSNYYDHNSMKTSSVSQFLTIKKDNLNPSSTTNTLDYSHTKDVSSLYYYYDNTKENLLLISTGFDSIINIYDEENAEETTKDSE